MGIIVEIFHLFTQMPTPLRLLPLEPVLEHLGDYPHIHTLYSYY